MPDEYIAPLDSDESLEEILPDDLESATADEALGLLSDEIEASPEDDIEVVEGGSPPIGRGFAYDFSRGRFRRGGHAPAETYGSVTLATWVEKCVRTQEGAHAACPDGYGLPRPLSDYVEERDTYGLIEAVKDAVSFHPSISSVKDVEVAYGDTVDLGDEAVSVSMTLVLDDGTEVDVGRVMDSGEEAIDG